MSHDGAPREFARPADIGEDPGAFPTSPDGTPADTVSDARHDPGTGSSTVWSVVQYGAGRSVTFVSTLILARLLAPESFGVVALAMLAINVFDRVKDLGAAPALVQHQGPWPKIAPTGLALTAGSAVVVASACGLSAHLLAHVLTQGATADDLVPILRALSFGLLLTGLGLFADAGLSRRLLFKQRVVPELVATTVRAALSISLAVAGAGAWSLVWGQVASSFVLTAGYWIAYRRSVGEPPRPAFDRAVARDLVGFGISLSWVALLSLVLDNIDYFVIGRRLGTEQLGYYTIAFRVPEMVVLGTCVAIGKVLYSSFSRIQDDREELRRRYLAATQGVAALTVPMGVGIAATAPSLVRVLFGEAYAPAVPLVAILGIYAAVYSLSFHTGEVYKALGKASIMTRLALTQVFVLAVALWFAAGVSTEAVALSLMGVHVVYLFLRLAIIRHVLDIRLTEQMRKIVPAVVAASVMGAAVAGLGRLGAGLPPLLLLTGLVGAGALAHLLAWYVVDRRGLLEHPLTRMLGTRLPTGRASSDHHVEPQTPRRDTQ